MLDMPRSMLMLINAFMFTDTAMVATAVPEYYYRLVIDIEELGCQAQKNMDEAEGGVHL